MKINGFEKLSNETKEMLKESILSAIFDVDCHFRKKATGDILGEVTKEQLINMPQEERNDWIIINKIYKELSELKYE